MPFVVAPPCNDSWRTTHQRQWPAARPVAVALTRLLLAMQPLVCLTAQATPWQLAFNPENSRGKNLAMLAQQGDPEAQFNLGKSYRYGLGVEQNPVEARVWLAKAAAQGHVGAQLALAHLLELGEGGAVDLDAALAWYRKAASVGETDACIGAGRILSTRHSGASEAVKWLEIAANRDEPEAQLRLALLLAAGTGVPRAEQTAWAWLERSATQNAVARILRGELVERRKQGKSILPQDFLADWEHDARGGSPHGRFLIALATSMGMLRPVNTAAAAFGELARQGVAEAQYFFALTLADRSQAPQKNLWMAKSAQAGYAEAQLYLATSGGGTSEDALRWLQAAARQGLPMAECDLGARLYITDETRDVGREWLQKAARQGVSPAAYMLSMDGRPGMQMGGDTLSEQQLVWLRSAAANGLADAQQRLGQVLQESETEAGEREAITWFERAAAQRDSNAALALGEAYLAGKGTARDAQKAAGYFLAAYEEGDPNGIPRLAQLLADLPDAAGLPMERVFAALNKELATGADADTLILMGNLCRRGAGIERDPARAMRYFRQAAQKGSARALVEWGRMYLTGDGVKRDYHQATRLFLAARATDDDWASVELARIYREGLGIPRDPARGIALLEAAANRGDRAAQDELGMAYERGVDRPKDLARAHQYFQDAAKDGWPAAKAHLLDVVEVDGSWALVDGTRFLPDLERRAKHGEAAAQCELAMQFRADSGSHSAEEIFGWMQKAATQRFPRAERELAAFLETGLSEKRGANYVTVHQDTKDALAWYRRAAGDGDRPAQLHLAQTWQISLPPAEKFRWALAAASAGDPDAQLIVAGDLVQGTGTAKNVAEARNWFLKAFRQKKVGAARGLASLDDAAGDPTSAFTWSLEDAKLGDSIAQFDVARRLDQGIGTAKDLVAALHWYQEAAADPDMSDAIERLIEVYEKGPVALRSEWEALRWYVTSIDIHQEGGDGVDEFGDRHPEFKVRYHDLANAYYQLGVGAWSGRGTSRRPSDAIAWLTAAAGLDGKFPDVARNANIQLFLAYTDDRGGVRDPKKALEVFKRLFGDDGDAATSQLKELAGNAGSWPVTHAMPAFVRDLEEAVAGNDVRAEFELGWLYLNGVGVPRNDARGHGLLQRAAQQHDVRACAFLLTRAVEGSAGEGLTAGEAAEARRIVLALSSDTKRAPTSSTKVAQTTSAAYGRAQATLAAALARVAQAREKAGVSAGMVMVLIDPATKSPQEIRDWATSQGIGYQEAADFWRVAQAETATEFMRSPAKRVAKLEEVAALGSPKAMAELGDWYASAAPKQDLATAYMWYCLAAARGEMDGSWGLQALAGKLSVQQTQAAQDRALAWWRTHNERSL